jgi:hypothetical protein
VKPSKSVRFAVLLSLPVAVVLAVVVMAQQTAAPQRKPTDVKLSGPYTHDNLTIFLVHGEDRFKGRTFLTLPEALEQKKFVIHETQSVNQLTMENLSPTEEVLILSGDILKGGQQDRIAQFDLLVPPKSGKLPLAAFCVEHTASRWMRELKGKDKTFEGSPAQVASNSIRLANRYKMSQSSVWKDVAGIQRQLSEKAGRSVQDKESDSSLALSLKVKEVREAMERYTTKLKDIFKDKEDVIGYAFAINGKVVAADIYGSPALFRKVWPRLLDANGIEAFAERPADGLYDRATALDVRAFLEEAAKGKASVQDVGKGVRQITNDAKRNVQFETQDLKSGAPLRTNILAH